MDVVGSEIGHKMRSAIKAKLTEIGCYVDDELPDYVMVMVANKRTRSQMEEDLNLFLGDNTVLFVGWLHQVLKKLQEVSISKVDKAKVKSEPQSSTSSSKHEKGSKKKAKQVDDVLFPLKSKEVDKPLKTKDKKDRKHKLKDEIKKAKKELKKKKEKKKSKHGKKKRKPKELEMIRPNVPPLFMNLEKESEPSITDVFAGQILKNHGVLVESRDKDLSKDVTDIKPIRKLSRPLIDPETVSIVNNDSTCSDSNEKILSEAKQLEAELINKPRDEQIREMNEIEKKIKGLQKKLADQLDTMSDDEDFLNIRTEAEELIGDFDEELPSESKSNPTVKATLQTTQQTSPNNDEINKQSQSTLEVTALPQIELNLPMRPIRDRLGSKVGDKDIKDKEGEQRKSKRQRILNKDEMADDRLTPPLELAPRPSIKDRLGDAVSSKSAKGKSVDRDQHGDSLGKKTVNSLVSVLEKKHSRAPASVVRVRPRPRPMPNTTSTLLMKAMADAQKSLFEIPPKLDKEVQNVKKALVYPMRRANVESQKIVVQIRSDKIVTSYNSQDSNSEYELDIETESLDSEGKTSRVSSEYIPETLTQKPIQTTTKYVPTLRFDVDSPNGDDTNDDAINVHAAATAADKGKGPTFVVTLDGLDPNVFLAKKLKKEGIIEDESELKSTSRRKEVVIKSAPSIDADAPKSDEPSKNEATLNLSDGSQKEKTDAKLDTLESRREKSKVKAESSETIRKRKASPIVFAAKKECTNEKTDDKSKSERDIITIPKDVKKFEKIEALPVDVRPSPIVKTPCRAFPLCKFGPSCAFSHPLCKFGSACTKRDCPYSHPELPPIVSSHVVPASNFKIITPATMKSICKFYPNCVNPSCHFFHPKLCRFGKNCINKLECNFYHHEIPAALKWKAANYKT